VLDILLQRRKDTRAAKQFFLKLFKKQEFALCVIVTDKLKSYKAANKQLLKSMEHRQDLRLNNRAENSYQPTRLRDRRMRKFKSPQAQRFLSAFEFIGEYFHSKQNCLIASEYRQKMYQQLENWREVTGLQIVA
jgi:putative transposase